MPPSIDIRELVRRYGDFEAVRGLILDIPAGEIFGLLGPNGAGKPPVLPLAPWIVQNPRWEEP